MTGNLAITGMGLQPYQARMARLLALPVACGPAFIIRKEPDFDRHMRELARLEHRFTLSATSGFNHFDFKEPEETPLKRKRRL